MKKTAFLIMIAAIAATTFWSVQRTEAQAAGAPALNIRVIDVGKILTGCAEYQDREKEVKQRGQQVQADINKLGDEINSLQDELKNALEPATKEYMAKLKEWFGKKAQMQALQDYEKESLTAETQAWTENLYTKLLKVSETVARQEGATLVLNKDESPVKSRSLQELFALIRSRQVIYNSSALEMTEKVIARLDLDYEKEKAAK